MEVMNYMLLCCALSSLDLVIIDVQSRDIVRQMSIHVALENLKEIEFIPTQLERHLEYGKLLSKILSSTTPLRQDKDYSFTFNFYSNGMEHCEGSSIASKLKEL